MNLPSQETLSDPKKKMYPLPPEETTVPSVKSVTTKLNVELKLDPLPPMFYLDNTLEVKELPSPNIILLTDLVDYLMLTSGVLLPLQLKFGKKPLMLVESLKKV